MIATKKKLALLHFPKKFGATVLKTNLIKCLRTDKVQVSIYKTFSALMLSK